MIGVFVTEAIRDYITIVKKDFWSYLKLIMGWEVFRIFKVQQSGRKQKAENSQKIYMYTVFKFCRNQRKREEYMRSHDNLEDYMRSLDNLMSDKVSIS